MDNPERVLILFLWVLQEIGPILFISALFSSMLSEEEAYPAYVQSYRGYEAPVIPAFYG